MANATENLNDGLFEIAASIDRLARAIERLGLGDAHTPMGAVELLAKEVRDGLGAIADGKRN